MKTSRLVSPTIASVLVGAGLGIAAVIGVASFSSSDSVPQSTAVPAEDALLGGPEYGTRQ